MYVNTYNTISVNFSSMFIKKILSIFNNAKKELFKLNNNRLLSF